MVNPDGVIALVPARGGSKSFPHKNLRPLAGHPLIAYSIAAGLRAGHVGRVIVSTDDQQIAAAAREYGAEVPFMRPASLAQDETTDLPVFLHALDWLKKQEGYRPELVVQLRPTSPLRPPALVDQALEALSEAPGASSLRGVIPAGQNPYKMWRINEQGRLDPLLSDGFEEPYNMPRQQLPQTYWQTGHIDVIRTATIEGGSLSGDSILPIIIDARYAVDIDTQRDHEQADRLVRSGELPLVRLDDGPRPFPIDLKLLVLDFDGVLTDNRVWVSGTGEETVAAHRGDGWGIARLKERGVHVAVISTETHPVVSARSEKLGLEVLQGVTDKAAALRLLLEKRGCTPAQTIFIGNDANDLPAFAVAGFTAVPADAHSSVKARADLVLSKRGGHGAVRELCDMMLWRMEA